MDIDDSALRFVKAECLTELAAAGDLDQERAHNVADNALLKFLRDIGHEDVADAFGLASERCGGFWYA